MNPYLTYSFFEGHTESSIIKGVGSEKVGQADIRVVFSRDCLQHCPGIAPALTTDCNKHFNQPKVNQKMTMLTPTW